MNFLTCAQTVIKLIVVFVDKSDDLEIVNKHYHPALDSFLVVIVFLLINEHHLYLFTLCFIFCRK